MEIYKHSRLAMLSNPIKSEGKTSIGGNHVIVHVLTSVTGYLSCLAATYRNQKRFLCIMGENTCKHKYFNIHTNPLLFHSIIKVTSIVEKNT